GRVIDAKDTLGIIGASITLISTADTNNKTGNVTDETGAFTIAAQPGQYILHIDYIGYKRVSRPVSVAGNDVNLGTITITTAATELKGVTVTGAQIRAEQKGDTSQFNAGAYKTNPDAS